MRIRNKKPYAIGLSYAGARKGYTLKPGGLSPELPADRFYHPQLQTDWKRGYIEVLLSPLDKAALGSSVSMFKDAGQVAVVDDVVVTPRPVPQPTAPTAQTIKEVLTERVNAATAAAEKYNETKAAELDAHTAAIEKYNDTADTPEMDPDGAEPIDVEVDAGPELCQRLGCKTIDKNVTYDERVSFFLCQYCRQQVTRRFKKLTKDEPEAMVSVLYSQVATAMDLGVAPAADVSDDAPDAEDDAPEQFGYGVSLSDLNQ